VRISAPGTLVFCAGQVALDRERNVVGKGDILAQTRQVFTNMQAVLREAGGDLPHVVKLTAYLTDFANLEGMLEARNEFPLRDFASSTVQVSRLVHPDLLVEIEATAVIE
jgi:enamine deaminase RidA (YjgF/YER057c/UK114 family)